MMEKQYYHGIDWLRVIACMGIVMMHMISKDNNSYLLTGFIAEKVIPSFTNFVFLFMSVSAFVLCVGYYEKANSERINWTVFYKKRYVTVLPFFSVVVLADVVFRHNVMALIEAIPNLTLTRGFFPNNIEQIGVAWFLGVIFVFYAIFPLFCILISSKQRAWIFFAVSIVLNFIVGRYYEIDRENIIYCLPFFVVGGLIYLYKDQLQEMKWYYFMPVTMISVVAYYYIGGNVYTNILISAVLLIQAIVIRGGKNSCISFLSGISMEVYLCHMVMFRLIEKLHLNTMLGNGWLQYIVTVIFVFSCAACFAVVVKKIIQVIENKFVRIA